MKKLTVLLRSMALLFGLTIIIGSKPVDTNNNSGYEYMSQIIDNKKEFTVDVFKAMPADAYTFATTVDVRTFGEQAFHIAYSMEWFNAQLSGNSIEWAPGDESRLSKDELIEYISKEFDTLKATVMKAEESPRFTTGIMGALDHNTHHLGQMVAYLRANGQTPPAYK